MRARTVAASSASLGPGFGAGSTRVVSPLKPVISRTRRARPAPRPVEHQHYQAPTLLSALGAVCCVALLIDKAADDITVYGYAAGLLTLGAVLWGINRVLGGPHQEIDPAKLVD